MATVKRHFYPGAFGDKAPKRFQAGAAVVEGTLVVNETSAPVGEVIASGVVNPAADTTRGLCLDTLTPILVQADMDDPDTAFPRDEFNTVRVVEDPFAVLRWRLSGTAASGGALAGSVAVVTNTSASAGGVTVTAAVGTNTRVGGVMICLSGENAGQRRRIASWVSNVSVTTSMPFPKAIAVGDTFLLISWAVPNQAVQLTTGFDEADGLAAVGAGGNLHVVGVVADISDAANPRAWIDTVLGQAHFNPVA